ncbi:MAG TPA: response regulator [Bdellovibrionales bacterium]|nr:response regulator [Bdellovibrionales bacterium]
MLIVDDDVHLRDAMALAVQRKGYQVMGAMSGNEATALLKNHKVDIVLSDIRMANGDGMELLNYIRAFVPTPPSVVLVTGYSDFTAEEALRVGAAAVIAKPFERMKLIGELDRIIGYERFEKKSA